MELEGVRPGKNRIAFWHGEHEPSIEAFGHGELADVTAAAMRQELLARKRKIIIWEQGNCGPHWSCLDIRIANSI